MDKSIRLRRPEDDIADQIKSLSEFSDSCQNVLRAIAFDAHLARTPGSIQPPTSSDIEASHGDR